MMGLGLGCCFKLEQSAWQPQYGCEVALKGPRDAHSAANSSALCTLVFFVCFSLFFLKYDQRGFGRHGGSHLFVGVMWECGVAWELGGRGFFPCFWLLWPLSGTGQREWLPPFPTSLGQA